MEIWLIQIGEPLPLSSTVRKMRTSMLSSELQKRGHRVTWWSSSFDHFQKNWVLKGDTPLTISETFTIIPLKSIGYRDNISLRRYFDHILLAKQFLIKSKRFTKPDVIVASTPPHNLAYAATRYGKMNSVPVLLDIRDPWPDIFLSVAPKHFRKAMQLLLRHDYKLMGEAAKHADSIVGVTSTLLDFGISYAGRSIRPSDRVLYLGCYKDGDPSSINNSIENLLNAIKGKFVVTFIGTFGHYNHPGIAIKCAKELLDGNVVFVLAGTGEFMEELREESANLPNVFFPGWLNNNEIRALLNQSHIGICPTPNFRDDAFHNKVFLYLSAGLPIISSFQGELKQIIDDEKIGFSFCPGDVSTFSDEVLSLYEQPDLYNEMSENASELFKNRFDAEIIYKEYADLVEEFAKRR